MAVEPGLNRHLLFSLSLYWARKSEKKRSRLQHFHVFKVAGEKMQLRESNETCLNIPHHLFFSQEKKN
jgi:hypothetical protein